MCILLGEGGYPCPLVRTPTAANKSKSIGNAVEWLAPYKGLFCKEVGFPGGQTGVRGVCGQCSSCMQRALSQ